MKLLIVGDVHWSQYSSILRTRSGRYSTRLNNLIQSVNWAERTAESNECEAIIYLGDFFDKSELNAEEITALSEVNWSTLPHWIICGTHEMGDKYHYSSSAKLFRMLNNFVVVETPDTLANAENITYIFLPYVLEDERKPLAEYIGGNIGEEVYVFSHNDIQMQYGQYKSVNGFTTDEIEKNCDKFFNGHLHNRQIDGKIENVGNLTGQNFSEDAEKYSHGVVIFDTETSKEWFIENPHALNFYKIDKKIPLKHNAIVSATVYENEYEDMKKYLDDNAMLYRIQVARDVSDMVETTFEEIINVDHISKFRDYVLGNIGNDELIKSELETIL